MIIDILPLLNARRIVLASSSPRRVELLTRLGLNFEVVPSTFPEDLDKKAFPTAAAYAEENARRKALEVWARLTSSSPSPSPSPSSPLVVVVSDSVVEAAGEVLEKPADADQARRYLRLLSGSQHRVHSGVCIVAGAGAGAGAVVVRSFAESTEVHFAALSDAIIEAYIATGEPFDKAGGYGIQGRAGAFVTGIRGCYYNVMGFPLQRFSAELRALVDAGEA